VARTHPAAGLHLQPGPGRDASHQPGQGVAARTRGIQVDQVQPARALAGIVARQRQRVVAVAGFLGVVALGETDDAAVADIDRRVEGEAAHAGSMVRKLSRRRAPAAAERSGWNCAPITLPRRTTAAKSRPWQALAMQSAVTSAA